jgi:hypothetical protein
MHGHGHGHGQGERCQIWFLRYCADPSAPSSLAPLSVGSTRVLSYENRELHLAVEAQQSHVLLGFVIETCYTVSDRETGHSHAYTEIDVVEFLAYLCAIHGHATARVK